MPRELRIFHVNFLTYTWKIIDNNKNKWEEENEKNNSNSGLISVGTYEIKKLENHKNCKKSIWKWL